MSRQLPDNPNLEFLKKQAKELLRAARQGKLADAQHTLANEYGFSTWAKLKSHVETLSLSPAEALKAAVCDTDADRVYKVLTQYPALQAKIDDPLSDYASANTRYTQPCSAVIGRRSMFCCALAPISASGRSGGPADSACSTIAIRAWSNFSSSAAR
jgi:hypothetical protein